ncbi:MAG: choice-of-anchor J domain-containing protein, partial [Acidobacteria bacterium]|nr:choice-of-anchor J domain-containing protein [Acidobacteriota bacterium]
PILSLMNKSYTDDCVGTGSGDGDGYIDPGEEVSIVVQIKNEGYLNASNIYGVLSTTQEGVSVLDNYAEFPNLAVGASGTSIAPHFKIKIDPSVSCGTTIPFTLNLYSNEGNWSSAFSLTVGHYYNPFYTIWSQSFDATNFPPAGWAKTDISGTSGDWLRATNTVHPSGGGTHSGAGLAYFNAYSATSGNSTRLYQTTGSLIPSGAVSAQVSFWMYHDSANPTKTDRIDVQVSTDGTTWNNPPNNQFLRYNATTGWQKHTVDISSYIGQSVRIGFLGTAKQGNDCHIDDVSLEYYSAQICAVNICTPSCQAPSQPSILSIFDNDSCSQSGITISFALGTPATRHDLYRDGIVVMSNVTSPINYNPQDTSLHSYVIKAMNSSEDCFADSSPQSFADGICSVPPEIAVGASESDALTFLDIYTIRWPSGAPPITGYRLYRGVQSDLPNLRNANQDFCKRYEGANTSADITSDNPTTAEGRCYYYFVTAYNGAGEGSAGNGRIVNSSGNCQ